MAAAFKGHEMNNYCKKDPVVLKIWLSRCISQYYILSEWKVTSKRRGKMDIYMVQGKTTI